MNSMGKVVPLFDEEQQRVITWRKWRNHRLANWLGQDERRAALRAATAAKRLARSQDVEDPDKGSGET